MVIKPLGSEVSPVDGTALSFGELKESRGMIEQYQLFSEQTLSFPWYLKPEGKDESEEESVADKGDKSWLKVSLASLKLRASQLGDYHRIHSPADWNALVRTHFAEQISKRKRLFPTEPPEEQVYDPQGHGVKLEKGKEVESSNTTPQEAWQIAQPPASGQ
ncbi:unnamed protein product [Brassica rapa]|uniref:Uncharacterized protein n=1 Tax=Brassica campestris TaxID=3711 RepID=A0A8D9GF45_BRACM|nr:unnamed protein product [Brassica rapa]